MKKILLTNRPGGAWGYITDSFANALRDKGHEVRRYDGQLDSWISFDPDLYIGCSGHKQEIPKSHTAKIAIHVNPFGPIDISGINEKQSTIDWVEAQKPDVVFGYGFASDKIYWDYWTSKLGIRWVPLPTAADKVLFKDLQLPRDLDVVYLGGRWPYKSLTIDSFLLPVLTDKAIKSELYGWGDWPPGASKGILPEDKVTAFLNRGLVGPCLSEVHTQKHGIDLPERVWKLILCGVLAIHDPVPAAKPNLDSAHVIMSSDPTEFKEMVLHYCSPSNKNERQQIADMQKSAVLSKHTYHHRISDLFASIGWAEESLDMIR
jgi:hypothetical protein